MIVSAGIFIAEGNEERYPEEDVKFIKEFDGPIHLGFFKHNTYLKWRDSVIEYVDKFSSYHMPSGFNNSGEMFEFFSFWGLANIYVMHPNRRLIQQLEEVRSAAGRSASSALFDGKLKVCIENFPWNRKKSLRGPIDIIKYAAFYGFDFCFDICHAEAVWTTEYPVFKPLAQSATVIHMSNKIAEPKRLEHIPISKGDINIDRLIKWLKEMEWDGEIVLEYMPKYRSRMARDREYIMKRLG